MILLFSVFITDKRMSPLKRYNLPIFDRIDVVRYTLASYAAINKWSKCIFLISLDDNYQDRKQQLQDDIESLFGKEKCTIQWERNYYVSDWQNWYNKLEADLEKEHLWIATDDDHVFMDCDTEMLDRVISVMDEDPFPLKGVPFSHWPEHVCETVWRIGINRNGVLSFNWTLWDSIQVWNKEMCRILFFYIAEPHLPMPRTNDCGANKIRHGDFEGRYFISTRELARHFDGYSNADTEGLGLHTITPPLSIPPGFFKKDIKILFYSDERREGWVNANPLNPDYYCANLTGTDYKWVVEDIPLFWKDRISEIEINKNVSLDDVYEARNRAYMLHLTNDKNNYRHVLPPPPFDWIKEHMRMPPSQP